RWALLTVVADDAVPVRPPVGRQAGVRRRRCHVDDLTLLEDRVGHLGLAREGGPHHGDGLVADDLLGELGRLGRITLGLPPLALYCWTASLTPLLMLMPSSGELLPVRAPKYPIFTGPPELPPELVVELEPHAAATRASTAAGMRSPQRARVGGAMAILLDVMIPR